MSAALEHDRATCVREHCGKCGKSSPSRAPAVPRNPHDAQQTPADPDPVIASIGLPKHPDPLTIAAALEDAAKALREHGLKAIRIASQRSARGYPARTLGDGGSRSSDGTSSTERLALEDRQDRSDWEHAAKSRDGWKAALALRGSVLELVAHADDVDPLPAGTGECSACARSCRPDRDKPGNRLRSGLCPSCYRAWNRYVNEGGVELWSAWVAKRRESYTERDAAGRVVKVHTPEPEHDLDLTTERATA